MRRSAFTLVEVLVVMAISSVVVLGIHAAYAQSHRVWSAVETGRLTDQAACRALETLRTELAALYWPPVPVDGNDANQPFQLVTTPEGQEVLSFFTLVPCWKTSPLSGRPAKVVYRFGPDKTSGATSLERVEALCAGERVVGTDRSDVILEGLAEGRIWVADPNSPAGEVAWKEDYPWSGVLPRAIKIRLRWPAPSGLAGTEFQACLLIPCGGPAGR